MRTRIWLLGLVALLLGYMSLPAAAQPIPPGSYLQSCQKPRISKGLITAFCPNRAGAWLPAGLPLNQCPPGADIANDDGRLVCRGGGRPGPGPGPGWGGPGPRPAPGPPPGPGWGGGGPGPGPGPGWGGGPPRGSYMASCRNVTMQGGTLNALCQSANGRWISTSINAGQCWGRDIANRNGRLTCR